tara:strand:- start:398 stop:1051 length:654 start_codon:yes stop_codon:yes gene_type:complete
MQIGITQRIIKEPNHGELRDELSHDWIDYFTKNFPKAFLIPIPNFRILDDDWFENLNLDLLILSNGNDLGEFSRRDKLERHAIKYAVNNSIPIIGFCRGFQIINEYFGGRLDSNIEEATEQKHVSIEHEVEIVNKRYVQMLEKKTIKVNSYHNHGVLIDGLSPSLKAFAISERSVVEGFFHEELPIMGIQWHPERSNNCQLENKILIDSIINKINKK